MRSTVEYHIKSYNRETTALGFAAGYRHPIRTRLVVCVDMCVLWVALLAGLLLYALVPGSRAVFGPLLLIDVAAMYHLHPLYPYSQTKEAG